MRKRILILVGGLAVGLVVAIFTLSAAAVSENIIDVNTVSDNLVAGDTFCTLREAINNANSDSDTTGGDCTAGSGDDVINIPAGSYLLSIAGSDEDANATGDLDILSNLTLQGAGSGLTMIDSLQMDRVLNIVTTGVVVQINDVTLENGSIDGQVLGFPAVLGHGGGGILNEGGTLTLNNTNVISNFINNSGGGDGTGAGILNIDGYLTLNNSAVSNNHITTSTLISVGGGIAFYAENTDAVLALVQSTVDLNSADGLSAFGGGIAANSSDGLTATLTMSQSIVSGNEALGAGGILFGTTGPGASISMTISGSRIENNRAEGVGGMLISGAQPEMTHALIKDSTFHANESVDELANIVGGVGGGLFADATTLTILRTTFSDNRIEEGDISQRVYGGGLYFTNGTAVIANSTFSGNEAIGTGPGASSEGGGLAVFAALRDTTVTILNSTVASNTAVIGGGGITLDDGNMWTATVNLQNTIVANNTITSAPDENCRKNGVSAFIISFGQNLENLDTCGFDPIDDIINTDPLLGPLQDNGGPTWTHALLDFSPAIDSANLATCLAPPVGGIDQRGVSRPIGPRCDIGAFESAALSPYNLIYLPVVLKS